MTTQTTQTEEPTPPTPQELIGCEWKLANKLANKLAKLGHRYPNPTFQYQLGLAIIGCENRIRAIQTANGLEVTV